MSNKKFIEDWKSVIENKNKAKCLNCGKINNYNEENLKNDRLGKHVECSNCGATFDIN